jgi:predicted DNA-binding transcriptional regulator AlpA
MTETAKYLTTRQVLTRYGRDNPVWLWRLIKRDEAFPRPIIIGGSKYFAIADLDAYDAAAAARQIPEPAHARAARGIKAAAPVKAEGV